jgi:hypothetical protein
MWHSSAVHVELGRGRLTRMASQARLAGLVLGCARPVPVVCQDSRCEEGKQASLGTAAAGSSIEQQWAEGPYWQCPHLWEPTALSLRAIGKAVEGITHVVCGPVDATRSISQFDTLDCYCNDRERKGHILIMSLECLRFTSKCGKIMSPVVPW